MKRVYSASDPADAHLMRGMLESNGIEAIVQGEALWSGRGDLPLGPESAPSVWVSDEEFDRARTLISEHERAIDPNRCANCGHDFEQPPPTTCPQCGQANAKPEAWICPECGESIEGQFAECWRCAGGDESQ